MHYKWKRYHYTMEHQSWLTSTHVLRLQAHLSLAQRCARFHRQYPEMRISVNKIREIYKKHMVRRKVLQEQKLVTRPHLERIDAEARRAHQELRDYVIRGFSIVYLDEVCFTKTTLPTLCWSAVRQPLMVDRKQYNQGYYSVIAAISYGRGLELIQIEKGAIDRARFKVFLE